MSEKITRRDFLKMAGGSAAAAAVLSGCGPIARYVRRQPYTDMPKYVLPGTSVYFATACRECPAGCGLVVRTVEGRAIKVEGYPYHQSTAVAPAPAAGHCVGGVRPGPLQEARATIQAEQR
ncbi:MAG TPA: twin-arginine translocation signal domain-containing protein [Anaerolineae bacterium]|nr:twin-arginine translocation signal domain-containing protein [Anaerolineae bacterium]